ncbi:MAG: hypothetical protein J3R72DRAFT_495932 [Linnemannia gamsii]|nr:MAG: hypothetical protein J3R72DRAFT_495932 [Linnemannia gamsii]
MDNGSGDDLETNICRIQHLSVDSSPRPMEEDLALMIACPMLQSLAWKRYLRYLSTEQFSKALLSRTTTTAMPTTTNDPDTSQPLSWLWPSLDSLDLSNTWICDGNLASILTAMGPRILRELNATSTEFGTESAQALLQGTISNAEDNGNNIIVVATTLSDDNDIENDVVEEVAAESGRSESGELTLTPISSTIQPIRISVTLETLLLAGCEGVTGSMIHQ